MLQKLFEFRAESGEAAHRCHSFRFADDSFRIAISFNERSRQILVRLAIDTPELSVNVVKVAFRPPFSLFCADHPEQSQETNRSI
jgi:hypothetical protein